MLKNYVSPWLVLVNYTDNDMGISPKNDYEIKKATVITVALLLKWRRSGDSNPGYPVRVHTLSRRAPSANSVTSPKDPGKIVSFNQGVKD